MVNPSLEAMTLQRDGRGWNAGGVESYAAMGLHASGDLRIGDALPDARAYVIGTEVMVQLADSSWTAPLAPALAQAITGERGLVLMLTSALSPNETPLSSRLVHRLIRDYAVALGWVAYAGDTGTAGTQARPVGEGEERVGGRRRRRRPARRPRFRVTAAIECLDGDQVVLTGTRLDADAMG